MTCGGLDNKVTLYKVAPTDEEMSKQKKIVATHTNYVSCNKFMHSDQLVRLFFIRVLSIIMLLSTRFE